MAEDAFGPAFEIHGGGLDLVFPHHENELAQSSALGHEFARIWTHNGMLDRGGEKMSKSLGNDTSLRNVLDTWGREVVLLFFMTAHWRKPMDFNDDVLEQAKAQVEALPQRLPLAERAGRRLERVRGGARRRLQHARGARAHARLARPRSPARRARCVRARIARRRRRVRRRRSSTLAERREAARAAKDFAEADRLRDEIAAAGWEVRDEAGGFRLVPAVSREQVYGRRPVREALRGPREVLELWATERAVKSETWLRDARAPARPGEARPRPLRGGGTRATTRACSRGASRSGTPTRTSSRRPSGRCSPASTRSATRATSAPSAGAPRARARPASSSPRTGRRASPRPSAARPPARSSTCRSRS